MSDNKTYYYIRLKEGFYDDDSIKLLESMPDGILYSNILLKMYLKSLKFNGILRLTEHIAYTPQMIATITRHQVGTVEKALHIFQQLGLVDELTDGTYYMSNIQEYIGKSSTEGDRKRLARAKLQTQGLLCGHLSDKRPPEIELDIYTELYPPLPPQEEGAQSSESLAVEMAAGAGTLVGHSKTLIANFEDFWNAYPRQQSKNAAEKAWIKIAPSSDILLLMLEAIEAAKKSSQWNRENGRYIPMPAKWLNEKRWQDKPTTPGQTSDRNNSSYDLSEIDRWINNGGNIK